jgi:hypothetical protein
MKRIIRALALGMALLLIAAVAPAQNLADVAGALNDFTNAMAPVLPVNSTVGSTWSDAYIGQLLAIPPHLGAGLTAGVTMVPGQFINTLFGVMGVDPATITGIDKLAQYGLPIPAAAVSARVGGIILPFDVGAKVGFIPEQLDLKALVPGATFEYLLYGADLRYALLDEKKNFIDLSIGVGYSYLKGLVEIALPIGAQSYSFTTPGPVNHTLALSEPALHLSWESHAVDITAQVSKQILILTPYIGAGLTIGKPNVKAGLKADLTLDGTPITTAEVESLAADLEAAGIPLPANPADLVNGYFFQADIQKGTDLRVYGGASLDLLIVRLDLNLLYSFIGRNFGASAGLRVQL